MQSSRRGSSLQHGQKRCRFHIWDEDFILVLGQLAVEHGVEHRAAHGQNVLWEDRKGNTVEGYILEMKKKENTVAVPQQTDRNTLDCYLAFTIKYIPEEESYPQLIYMLLLFLMFKKTIKKTPNKNKKQTVAALIP